MSKSHSLFRADKLTLRRGSQLIWNEATWELHGHAAILGANGSGKSSTLSMLAGQLMPDSGTLTWSLGQQHVSPEQWMTSLSLSAPWSRLPSQMTVNEALTFHGAFRPFRPDQESCTSLLMSSGLKVPTDLPISRWSSGQRQRLELALALGTQSDVVLLDEPTSNLDADGVAWYQRVLERVGRASTIIVATNEEKKDAPEGASILRI